MKKLFLMITIAGVTIFSVTAQDKMFTKTGVIIFDASGKMETITAENKKATCIVDSKTGAMEFAVLMKAFEFEKALMQEHFNENYVESDTYPKTTFKGKIDNLSEINFIKDGSYPAKISGDLTMHGVTKQVTTQGNFVVKNGMVAAQSEFKVLLSDYNISIPKVVKENISDETKIKVEVMLEPLK